MTIDPLAKIAKRSLLGWAAALASAAIIAISSSGSATAEVKTLEAGKLTIGMNGDMPMTQLKDGVLSVRLPMREEAKPPISAERTLAGSAPARAANTSASAAAWMFSATMIWFATLQV